MSKKIASQLSAAACSLLAASSPSQAQTADADLIIDSGILYYSETDRVTAVAPQINIRKEISEDDSVEATITYDSVSGASPTGEVPYGTVQTVTSPSGVVSTVSGDTKPSLDFKDTRTALSANWTHRFDRQLALNLGLNSSSENDYDSSGGSVGITMDSADKLTTWSLATSVSNDTIYRSDRVDHVPGIPQEFTNTSLLLRQSDHESRDSNDIVAGLTQVLTARTLMQLSLTRSESDGYHSDPYKLISVVDGNGVQVASYYEKRPDSRARDILFSQIIHNIDDDVLRIGFRYYRDDWGINSATFDIKYKAMLKGYYLQPHLRLYQQSAADFHQFYLNTTDTAPEYASADSRLAEFDSYTVGLSSGFEEKNYRFDMRLEYMSQDASPDRSNDPVNLRAFNLFNGVDAIIAQINLSISF